MGDPMNWCGGLPLLCSYAICGENSTDKTLVANVHADLEAIAVYFPGVALAAVIDVTGEVVALKGPAAGTSLAATIGASSATAAGTGPALDAIVPPPRPTFHIDPQRCISAIPPLKRAVAAHCEASIGSTLSSSVATGGGGGDDGGQGGAGRHGGGGIRSPCLHVKGSRSLFSIYEWAGTSVVLVCEVAPGVASGIDTVALDSLVLPQLRELHEHVRMLMAALNAR